jgi:hypothetical protein
MIIHVINEHNVIKLIVMHMPCNYNKISTTYMALKFQMFLVLLSNIYNHHQYSIYSNYNIELKVV